MESSLQVLASATSATQKVANSGSVKKVFSMSSICARNSGFRRLESPPLASYMKWRSWSVCGTERSARLVYRLVCSCALDSAYELETTSFLPRSQS